MMVRSYLCRLEFMVGPEICTCAFIMTGHLTGSINVLTCQDIRSILGSHAARKNKERIRRKRVQLSARSMDNS